MVGEHGEGSMIRRLFLSHPHACGESYLEHARASLGFALPLIGAGFAALVHAVAPALFETTASRTVLRLHPIAARRSALTAQAVQPAE
jgi:hypothetical protein